MIFFPLEHTVIVSWQDNNNNNNNSIFVHIDFVYRNKVKQRWVLPTRNNHKELNEPGSYCQDYRFRLVFRLFSNFRLPASEIRNLLRCSFVKKETSLLLSIKSLGFA